MTSEQAGEAAGLLRAARRTGVATPLFSGALEPADFSEAYAIQAAFLGGTGPDDPALEPVGYKLACTSPIAQAALGIDGPLTGRLLDGWVFDSPAALQAGDFLFRLIEPEFAFRIGGDLPARGEAYREDEVAAAVASVHPAFEVVTSRFGETDWWNAGALRLASDNAVHGALVLGTGSADWSGDGLAAQAVTLSVNGEEVSRGVGANALGGPLTALTWLANRLATNPEGGGSGPPLKAGDIVTTGLVTDFKLLGAGDRAAADFGPLGQVSLRFEA